MEVHIGVLRGSAQGGMLRGEAACSMGTYQVIVHHEAELFICQLEDLGHFVGGSKSIKEVHKWNTGFECGRLGYGGEILRHPPRRPVAAARRKALLIDCARLASERLARLEDPEFVDFV